MTAAGPDQNNGISSDEDADGVPVAQGESRGQDNNYLIEHNMGSIISCSFEIYSQHFGTLLLIFVLPVLPLAMIIQFWLGQSSHAGLPQLAALLVFQGWWYFAYGATTVAVSDICLGNSPSFRRSYSKILSKIVLLLAVTNLLQAVAIGIGFLLLVIPGLTLIVWLLVTPPVVVLERKGGFAAFKRSKQLCDGSHWRNAAVYLFLTILPSFLVPEVIRAISRGILGAIEATFPELLSDWMIDWLVSAVLMVIQHGLVAPISLISLVLVYYDRRVRKEGYDAKALAEDLAR